MTATKNTYAEPYSDINCLTVKFYPPRLSDTDVEHLEIWADRAIGQPAPAPRFAAYLTCVAEFERERRAAIDGGNEIVEAYMTPLPCGAWSNREVAHALGKITAIASSVDGEMRNLFIALQHAIVAESQNRLDPQGPSGPQVDRAWNK